jgi:hypothetical protein
MVPSARPPMRDLVAFLTGSYTIGLGSCIASTTTNFDVLICNAGTRAEPACRLIVPDKSCARAIHEIRLLSGLTWDEIGILFRVSRRSAHNWANGEPLKPENSACVRHALLAIQRLCRPSSAETRLALLAPLPTGERALDLLAAKKWPRAIAEVRALPAMPAPNSPHPDQTQRHPLTYVDALPDRPVPSTGRAVPGRSRRLPTRRP